MPAPNEPSLDPQLSRVYRVLTELSFEISRTEDHARMIAVHCRQVGDNKVNKCDLKPILMVIPSRKILLLSDMLTSRFCCTWCQLEVAFPSFIFVKFIQSRVRPGIAPADLLTLTRTLRTEVQTHLEGTLGRNWTHYTTRRRKCFPNSSTISTPFNFMLQ
jgi:hypothetical protein